MLHAKWTLTLPSTSPSCQNQHRKHRLRLKAKWETYPSFFFSRENIFNDASTLHCVNFGSIYVTFIKKMVSALDIKHYSVQWNWFFFLFPFVYCMLLRLYIDDPFMSICSAAILLGSTQTANEANEEKKWRKTQYHTMYETQFQLFIENHSKFIIG